jgi:hypothetical protein
MMPTSDGTEDGLHQYYGMTPNFRLFMYVVDAEIHLEPMAVYE